MAEPIDAIAKKSFFNSQKVLLREEKHDLKKRLVRYSKKKNDPTNNMEAGCTHSHVSVFAPPGGDGAKSDL